MKNKKIIDISDNRTLLSKFSYLYAKINRLMNHFKKAALSAVSYTHLTLPTRSDV